MQISIITIKSTTFFYHYKDKMQKDILTLLWCLFYLTEVFNLMARAVELCKEKWVKQPSPFLALGKKKAHQNTKNHLKIIFQRNVSISKIKI